MISLLPGLFHITLQSNIASIVAHGIQPGHVNQTHGGRMDRHFSPFPPYDRRNEMMRHKIKSINKNTATWVVISVNPWKCPKDSLRFCLANSIILSTVTIPSSAFEGIWTLSWSDSRQALQQWIYEPSLEKFAVTQFRGLREYTDEEIVRCIAVGDAACRQVLADCQESSILRMSHYNKARDSPIRADEQEVHEGIPLRRCPACLKATSSRMTYCLRCNAEFLG